MPEDFISGRDLARKIYWNNVIWALNMKSLRIEHLATEATDQVGGEQRARFQTITDGFRVSVEAFIDSKSAALENYITSIANDDAGAPQLPLGFGVVFKYRNLSRGAISFTECTLDPFDLNDSDRTARTMFSMRFRARWMNTVPAQ